MSFSLIIQSFKLDGRFIKVSPWKLSKKMRFLYSKYISIIRHFFIPFKLGISSVTFEGEKIYYDSKLGLAGYQSMLSRHQYMIQVAQVKPSQIKTIIDCGANVGFFSLMVNDVFHKANIYAIEPVPITKLTLQINVESTKRIKVFEVAISDKEGYSHMSFDKNDSVTSQISSKGPFKVPTLTLDTFCAKNNIENIDILKIDTETFEAHALRGAKDMLGKTKYLFLEISLREHGNYSMSSIMSLLHSKSYDFQLIAFRNYANRSEGAIEIMDCLLINKKFSK